MKIRPKIGVTGPRHGGAVAWFFTALAIYRVGGSPRRLMPGHKTAVDELDGLILGGGADLDPSLYRAEPAAEVIDAFKKERPSRHRRLLSFLALPLVYLLRRIFSIKEAVSPDGERDAFEIDLLKQTLNQKKPILGICRGAQLLNAVLGGSLHPEIRGFYIETPYVRSVLRRKRIHIVKGSRLASILPRPSYWVNSLHHQAVHDVAPQLRVAAREDTQLVQAIESPEAPFILGVQWHPEFLPHAPSQQAIFRALVKACRQSV